MSDKVNKMQEVFDKVVNHMKGIVEKGEYEKFLKFQKGFRGYSFNNLILIYSQFPEATMVAGKAKWLKLKREILPGARKIFILAPIPRSYQKVTKVIENDEEVEKIQNIHFNYYRYVYVYDISQTKGEPIPLQVENIDSNNMDMFYEKLQKFSKVPVIEKKIIGGAKGYYDKEHNVIAIRDSLSTDDKTAVLLHEIAHSLYDDFDYSKDRNLSEVFVESIAYIVADYFGLDTSNCSFNYIAHWANGDPKVVLELGNKIQKCANEYIDKLEKFEYKEKELGKVA